MKQIFISILVSTCSTFAQSNLTKILVLENNLKHLERVLQESSSNGKFTQKNGVSYIQA